MSSVQTQQPRVAFSTIGCRLNQAETALLKDGFRRRGFLPVEYGQDTDVLVLNSCTVTEGAEADCRRLVRQTLEVPTGVCGGHRVLCPNRAGRPPPN